MKLKTGQQCIAWNADKVNAVRGTFLTEQDGRVLVQFPLSQSYWYENAELDPDANRFLPEDKVEVSDSEGKWVKATYIGYNQSGDLHHCVENEEGQVEWFKNCRYSIATQNKIQQIRNTISLLNSMVIGGEKHSSQSNKEIEKAFNNLTKIEEELENDG